MRIVVFALVGMAIVGCLVVYGRLFGAPQGGAPLELFIVARDASYGDTVERLLAHGFIRSRWALDVALGSRGVPVITSGGYSISPSFDAWDMADVFSSGPTLVWVIIPEGLRKEETADILSRELAWDKKARDAWVATYTSTKQEYIEGVYFPDTYLIPKNEQPEEVALRLQRRFEEIFAEYAKEARAQNIKWDTVIKIASLIQREAAGSEDMPLIAGVLWNRLAKGMKLDIDATVQYARGHTGSGWWAPIAPQDKSIDSPYNTYRYKGLPPHPIASPGRAAIEAVLRFAETDCVYYLHDALKRIHCAVTYEEHKKNIEKYL